MLQNDSLYCLQAAGNIVLDVLDRALPNFSHVAEDMRREVDRATYPEHAF